MQSNLNLWNYPGIANYTEYVDYPCHFERLNWLYSIVSKHKDHGREVMVLDVGCGTGNITIPLGLIQNSKIKGIDIHQGNIDISKQRNKLENVEIAFENLFDCPVSDFDFIILTEVLEHISFYPKILGYLSMYMKPGAQLLITVPNGRGPFEISMQPIYLMRRMGLNKMIDSVKRLLGKKEPYSCNYETPHVNFFTVRRLKRELEELDFVLLEVKKAYVFSPIIETYLPFIGLKRFSRADNKLAWLLPRFMTSGHYYRFMKKM